MTKLGLYTDKNLDELRRQGDPLADRAVAELVRLPDLCQEINSWNSISLNQFSELPDSVKEFFEFYSDQAKKVPQTLMKDGQQFFNQKGDLYLAMLGFYSLPYCYAFADGAQVLIRSNRIIENIGERLGETGSFLLDIFEPGAFYSNQKAYLTCAKVRLIHAFSRYFINHYAKDWNTDYGVPVNQEDMIGTNLAFSLMVLRGLRKIGRAVSTEEATSIIQYWSWIGSLMGINTEFWPETPKEAYELEKSIRRRHLKPSTAGQTLAKALINYYKKTIPDAIISSQAESMVSFFCGREASKALNLKEALPVDGNLLGVMLRAMGIKNFGGKKDFYSIQNQFRKNQQFEFGRALEIQIPVLKRS